ncbi:MAG: hypothetical protein SXV54_11555 [Chloroflexota bacterium]|nr:hypothetical protein [Chloroflexota bacterium]
MRAYSIDPLACEGYASCFYQCPEEAIRMEEQQAGLWFRSEPVLVDGPPGIGCPVISASAGVDVALHVVEPTVSGIRSLWRTVVGGDQQGGPEPSAS